MHIGTFSATADGFAGRLSTLTLETELILVPAEHSDSENAPDYRVLTDRGEEIRKIGAGWKRTGGKAGAYVAVQIDDPAFVQPLRANLFKSDGGTHLLVWSRRSRRAGAN